MAFIWAFISSLHHSIVTPSLLISKKKKIKLHNCNLLVFILLDILDLSYDFPILDRNLIVLIFFIYILFIHVHESEQMYMHEPANLQYYIHV